MKYTGTRTASAEQQPDANDPRGFPHPGLRAKRGTPTKPADVWGVSSPGSVGFSEQQGAVHRSCAQVPGVLPAPALRRPRRSPAPALPALGADGQAARTRKESSCSPQSAVTSAAAAEARSPAAPRPSSRARGLRLPSRARPVATAAAVGPHGRHQHRTFWPRY